ncbi:MAG: hypothetical protein GX577_05445 [Leptolinea sp.]|uniref:hypothetical protein n=1 Tax=Syntrophus aciditrophicus TaxID=316277 RepID=UPI0011D0CF64|nr:hypothetical protein [Syntrophus aciditrophicus]NLF50561.1 hypothetical protein [Leptolinea sp.]
MGGWGSGKGSSYPKKKTTESQHRIDIRWLKKHGYLQPGSVGSLSWSFRGEQTGSIGYRMEADHMILSYQHRFRGGDWESVEQKIILDWTVCNYGGTRPWFLCPNCGKRVAVLYGAGKLFLCRHCYGLTYSSQQEGVVDRILRRQRKIRTRLGAADDLVSPILFKPKGMHQKTFDRLLTEEKFAGYLSAELIVKMLGINVRCH